MWHNIFIFWVVVTSAFGRYLNHTFDHHHPILTSTCPVTSGSRLNVAWGPAKPGECVLSHPVCVGDTMVAVPRCCTAAGWDKEPFCADVQQTPQPCPAGYMYHVGKELCYRLTDRTIFPPTCGNEDTVIFSEYRSILDETVTEPVWMPVTRDNSNGMGAIMWTELSDNYKLLFNASRIPQFTTTLDPPEDCVVYHNGTTHAVSCMEQHRAMCAYTKLENSNSYCRNKQIVCRPKHYENHNDCFCVQYVASEEMGLQRGADILYPFQNLIIKSLTSDSCLIGLERFDQRLLLWINSNEKVNYSYWSPDVRFSPENISGLFTQNGWLLTSDDINVKCVIHEQTVDAMEPKLMLNFRDDLQSFELFVENIKDLKKFDEVENKTVFCFTDAHAVQIIYRLPSLNASGHSITFPPLDTGPGHYWCEGIRYLTFEVVKSNSILYHPTHRYGCEYIAILRHQHYMYNETNTEFITEIQNIYSRNFLDYHVRIFKVVSIDRSKRQIRLNVHFTEKTILSILECPYRYSSLHVRLNAIRLMYLSLESLSSSSHCMETSDSTGLTWPIAKINTAVFPIVMCITENGTLLVRYCSGNFSDGAKWEALDYSCKHHATDNVSQDLYDLLKSNRSTSKIVDGLYNITKEYRAFSTLDIFLIGRIYSKIASKVAMDCLATLLNVTSLLNDLDRHILREAQDSFNATDQILHGLDYIFSNITLPQSSPQLSLQSSNTLMKAVDISMINITGVALYKDGSAYNLEYLDDRDNLSRIIDLPNFQSAVLVPYNLRQQIVNSNEADNKLIFVVYVLDSLFNSRMNETKKVSHIFDVLIPKFNEAFIEPIEILFKTSDRVDQKSCVHWSFPNAKGHWKNDNKSLEMRTGVKCYFWHVTHFALLFLERPDDVINFNHVLDLITDINCMLSLVGLLFILLTAVLFKRWRTNTGNKVLINFVFAIAFQISLLYISDLVYRFVKVNDLCTIVGAMLHYSIISEFCWMLIVAILQFKRFVEVLGGQPKYIMLKACVVGWILPLFPVLCVLFLDPKSYITNKVGLCYPSGLSLYLSIWIPVGIIVAINFVIFTYILYSVSTKNTDCLIDKKESYYQWRLAVLLFFMLGLTWSFGLLIQLDFGILFVYLFTFSATLQGFIMFLFFIIFNKNTRILYMQYVRNCYYSLK